MYRASHGATNIYIFSAIIIFSGATYAEDVTGSENGKTTRDSADNKDNTWLDKADESEGDYYEETTKHDSFEIESTNKTADSGSITPIATTSSISTLAASTFIVENSSPVSATNSSTSSTAITAGATTPTEISSPVTATDSSTSSIITTLSSTPQKQNGSMIQTTNKFSGKLFEHFYDKDSVNIKEYFENENAQPNRVKITSIESHFKNNSQIGEQKKQHYYPDKSADGDFHNLTTKSNSLDVESTIKIKPSGSMSPMTTISTIITTLNTSTSAVKTSFTPQTENSSSAPVTVTSTTRTLISPNPTENSSPVPTTNGSKMTNLSSTTPKQNASLIQTTNKLSGKLSERFYGKDSANIQDYFKNENAQLNGVKITSIKNYVKNNSQMGEQTKRQYYPDKSADGDFHSSTMTTLSSTTRKQNASQIQTTNKISGKLTNRFYDDDSANIKGYYENENMQPNRVDITSIENHFKNNSQRGEKSKRQYYPDKSADFHDFTTKSDSLDIESTNKIENSGSMPPTANISSIATLAGSTSAIETNSNTPAEYSRLTQGESDRKVNIDSGHLVNKSNVVHIRASDKLDDHTIELRKEIDNLKGSVDALKTVVASLDAVSGKFLGTQKRQKRVAQRAKEESHIRSDDNKNMDSYQNTNISIDHSANMRLEEENQSFNVANSTSNSEPLKNENIDQLTKLNAEVEINGTLEREQELATEPISGLLETTSLKNFSTNTSANVSVARHSGSDNKSDEMLTLVKTINANKINPVASEKLISSSDLVKFSMLQLNSSINSLIASFEEILDASNSTFSSIVKRFDVSKSRVSSSADKLKLSTNQLTGLMSFLDPSAGTLPAVLQLSNATDAVKLATERLSLSFTSIVAAKAQTLRNLSESISLEFDQFRNMSRDVVNVAVRMSSLFQPMLKIVEDFKGISRSEDLGSTEHKEVVEISERGKFANYHPKPRESDKELDVKSKSSDDNKQHKGIFERKLVKDIPVHSESKKPPMLTDPKGTSVPSGNQTNPTWKSKMSNFLSKDIPVKVKAMLGILGIVSWGAYIFNSVK